MDNLEFEHEVQPDERHEKPEAKLVLVEYRSYTRVLTPGSISLGAPEPPSRMTDSARLAAAVALGVATLGVAVMGILIAALKPEVSQLVVVLVLVITTALIKVATVIRK